MRVGVTLSYAGGFAESVELLEDYRRVGVSIVFVPEAYTFDSVSQLGYLAAKVPGIELATDILAIYTRTPSLIAMTAAGIDYVSGGRFTLGIGASGPQVVEGFHGLPYDVPLGRTRDVIEICRSVWRRDRLDFHNGRYDIPLSTERGGSGLGKPLKLINTPLRERIPIFVASMGPKNVELTAELAEGWAPFFYHPEHAAGVWADSLAAGNAKRADWLPPLDVIVPVSVAIGPDAGRHLDEVRPHLALYIGGMGAKGKNFYHQLATRYGFGEQADRIQDLYLAGNKSDAIAAVPDDLVSSVSLVGDRGYVGERVAAMREAGVTTFASTPIGATHEERVASMAALVELVG